MKRIFVLIALLPLAACGVDGEPVQPSMNTTVGVGSNGVSGSTNVTVKSGNVSIGVGVGY